MNYPDLIHEELNYTAIAIAVFKYLPVELRMQLHDNERTQDVIAWAMTSAVESYNEKRSYRKAKNAANRAIYHALKAEGYRRERSANQQYQRRELRFCQVQDASQEILEYINQGG